MTSTAVTSEEVMSAGVEGPAVTSADTDTGMAPAPPTPVLLIARAGAADAGVSGRVSATVVGEASTTLTEVAGSRGATGLPSAVLGVPPPPSRRASCRNECTVTPLPWLAALSLEADPDAPAVFVGVSPSTAAACRCGDCITSKPPPPPSGAGVVSAGRGPPQSSSPLLLPLPKPLLSAGVGVAATPSPKFNAVDNNAAVTWLPSPPPSSSLDGRPSTPPPPSSSLGGHPPSNCTAIVSAPPALLSKVTITSGLRRSVRWLTTIACASRSYNPPFPTTRPAASETRRAMYRTVRRWEGSARPSPLLNTNVAMARSAKCDHGGRGVQPAPPPPLTLPLPLGSSGENSRSGEVVGAAAGAGSTSRE